MSNKQELFNAMEISKLTGYVHRTSWKFWCRPFSPRELIYLKSRLVNLESLRIERCIWDKMLIDREWGNWISFMGDGRFDAHVMGLGVDILDR